MAVNRTPAVSRVITILLLVLGLAALLGVQALASAKHWLRLPFNAFDDLRSLSCSILPVCELRFPSHFGIVVPLLLLGIVLLALGLRRTAQGITRDIPWLTTEGVRPAGRWRASAWAMVAVSLVVSAVSIYSALAAEDRYPNAYLWFITIIVWGGTIFLFDRANGRSAPLRRATLLRLAGYGVLVFALGFVYHLPQMAELPMRIAFVVIAALVAFTLWRLKRVSGTSAAFICLAVAGLAAYTYQITSWRYSFIGDEYLYYWSARDFGAYLLGGGNVLNSNGVYQANPVFGTYIQALILRLYGGDIYSWRVGGGLLVLLTAPGIFWIVRRITNTGAGLFAAAVFVSVHYLIAISRVGYVQPELLPVFIAMLVFGLLALEKRSALAIYLSGAAGAFSFFTFTLGFPLIPTPLLMLTIWVLWRTPELAFLRRLRAAFLLGVVFLIGVLAVAFPRVLNTSWISESSYVTVFEPEREDLTNPFVQQVIPNVLYTLGGSLHFDVNSHYTSGALLDPLSSFFMLAGIAGAVAAAFRRRTALWLLLSFLAAVAVIGGFLPYPYPNHTRMYFMEMYYAMFAGLGAAYLWAATREFGLRLSPTLGRVAFAGAVLLIVALNLYQFLSLSQQDIPKNPIALIVQQFEETTPQTSIYLVARVPDDANLARVLENNGYDLSRLHPVMNPDPEAALSEIQRDAAAPYRVLFLGDLPTPQPWFDAAQTLWSNYPRQLIFDEAGNQFLSIIDVPAS